MKRRTQLYILGGLLLVLAAAILSEWGGGPEISLLGSADEKRIPLAVADAELRLDLLERAQKQEYAGMRRNIFSFSLPPPPPPKVEQPADTGPVVPPPPPPLQIPFRFYCVVTDVASDQRRACFTNGDDVFILREGDLLMNRYRLLRIGNTTADFEEVSTGRRATLQLEQ